VFFSGYTLCLVYSLPLSVPVQLIAWEDSSSGTLNLINQLTDLNGAMVLTVPVM